MNFSRYDVDCAFFQPFFMDPVQYENYVRDFVKQNGVHPAVNDSPEVRELIRAHREKLKLQGEIHS